MPFFRILHIITLSLFFCLGWCSQRSAAAADISVSAELSRPEINVGEMAELQLKVTGAEVADVPREVAADGLQIRLTGQSTQVQMVNFKVTSSAVYSYIVMPLRSGKFTIPSILVRTSGGVMQTTPLSFSVIDGSGMTATSGQGSGPSPTTPQPQQLMPGFSQRSVRPAPQKAETGRLAFGEIICPKKTLYLGEMAPVEIRYYFDARYPVQVKGKVDFASEGILVERFPDPKESREDRDGVTYNVLSFQTLLSAVKPGSIEIAPAKLESQIQMPGALPPGFDDPVFQQMLGGRNPFSQARDVTVKTAPLHLEVLPLPKEGRPASFGGAVGQFEMDAVVPNPKPAPGDPAILTVKIGGKGNFRAMGVPQLTETDGWRTYPPADRFESSDQLSYAGVKSFDFTMIAQQPMKSSPGSEFSYFDPTNSKFVTLTTKPLPLSASPALAGTPAAVNSQSQATPQQNVPTSPNAAAGVDKTGGEDLNGSLTLRSWKSPVQRSEFVIASVAMILAVAALAGVLHFRNLQAQQGSVIARRRRLVELLSLLKTGGLDATTSYDVAVEYLTLLHVAEDNPTLLEIRTRRDLLKYGVGGSVALSDMERERLTNQLVQVSEHNA